MTNAGSRNSQDDKPSNHLYLRADSPRRNDSPSRQLQFELVLALENLDLHDLECHKVQAYNRRSYQQQLDARECAREKADLVALDAAIRSRDETRRRAEVVLQQVVKEQEEQRRRLEEEERLRREREVARQAREKAERERRAREEQLERQARIERENAETEEARRKAEEQRREKAERQRREEESAERARQEKEQAEQDQKTREQQQQKEADARKAQAEQNAATNQQAATTSAATGDDQKVAESQHQDYLKLYARVKQFKEKYWEDLSQNKAARKPVGDARRSIRAEFQKLTAVDTKANNLVTEKIKHEILRGLQSSSGPMLPVNQFLPAQLQLNDNDSQQIPAVVAYLLSIFAKQAIQTCTGSIADQPKLADAFSLTVVKIFSLPELLFERHLPSGTSVRVSLFSILLCKFHKVAPGLFGITANEKTPAGKKKMGWRLERQPEDNPIKNVFVSEHVHFGRVKGIATGYAAIASRNFAKSKSIHPYPPKNLWQTVARIVNMKPDEVQITHILLLRSMFTPEVLKRFILFYGNVAIAVLREAFVELPKRLPAAVQNNLETRDMLQMVFTVFEGEEHLHLGSSIGNQSRSGAFGR